jgi:ribosome-associated toxin RatA of RatAB toxin-antitoxin module
VNLESSILIDSPIQKVYKTAETYPTFVKFYTIKSIIENNDNRLVVDVGYRLFGFSIHWIGMGDKIKFHSINYVQTEGFLKGMRANWNFISEGNKTRVSIDIEIKKSILFLNWFIKKRVQKISNGILQDLKDTTEKGNI